MHVNQSLGARELRSGNVIHVPGTWIRLAVRELRCLYVSFCRERPESGHLERDSDSRVRVLDSEERKSDSGGSKLDSRPRKSRSGYVNQTPRGEECVPGT